MSTNAVRPDIDEPSGSREPRSASVFRPAYLQILEVVSPEENMLAVYTVELNLIRAQGPVVTQLRAHGAETFKLTRQRRSTICTDALRAGRHSAQSAAGCVRDLTAPAQSGVLVK
jgi:hypothetical protein